MFFPDYLDLHRPHLRADDRRGCGKRWASRYGSPRPADDEFLEQGVRLLLLLRAEHDRHHLLGMQRAQHTGRVGFHVRACGDTTALRQQALAFLTEDEVSTEPCRARVWRLRA